MVKYIDDVLTELGWSDGLHVPVANAENAALEAEMERLLARRTESTAKLTDLNRRISELEQHKKNIEHEQGQGQVLLSTLRAQIDEDEDRLRMAQNDQDGLLQDIQKMKKKARDIEQRHSIVRDNVAQMLSRLDKLKQTVSFDTDAIRLWEDALARSQEDNDVIQKFSLQDETKAKELELRRQKLKGDVTERKNLIEKCVSEITTFENVLNKSAQLYKNAMMERKHLIKQWRNAVNNLRQRNNDIVSAREEIENLNNVVAEKKERLEEQKEFYKNEINNNAETMRVIESLNKESSRSKNNLNVLIQTTQQYYSELSSMKRELATVSNKVTSERMRGKQLRQETDDKKVRLQNMKKANKELEENLEDVINKAMTSTERSKHLEKLVEREEKNIKALQEETDRLQNSYFRLQGVLRDLNEEENLITMEIENNQTSLMMLQKQEKMFNNTLTAQKEEIYNFDFKIQTLESRISTMKGEKLIDDHDELSQKLQDLETVLAQKNSTHFMLQVQVTRLEDDIRRLGAGITSDAVELNKLKDKLQDSILLEEGGRKQTKEWKIRSQQRQVEENILRLQVSQAEKTLEKQGNALYSLEKYRLELDAAMKERQLEINIQKDILVIKKRALGEDRGKVRSEISERLLRLEQHKKKHDIAVSLLGKDESGEPLTVAHIKIQAAQEKAFLQKDGDMLDAKIRQAEREIVAMENTLKVVNLTNETYKRNLGPVEQDDPEAEEMRELEDAYYTAMKKLQERRKQDDGKKKSLLEGQQTLEEINQRIDEIVSIHKTFEKDALLFEKELQVQKQKLLRADKQLTRLRKEARLKGNIELEEKDMAIREMRERNESVLQQLAELVARHRETEPTVNRYLSEHSLSLPVSRQRMIPTHSTSSLNIPKSPSNLSVQSNGSCGGEVSNTSITPQTLTLNVKRPSKSVSIKELKKESSSRLFFKPSK